LFGRGGARKLAPAFLASTLGVRERGQRPTAGKHNGPRHGELGAFAARLGQRSVARSVRRRYQVGGVELGGATAQELQAK
jgi:hypothetical protein